jgi:hypothetical protein
MFSAAYEVGGQRVFKRPPPDAYKAVAADTCRWRITEITQLSAFGISLDNASAIDNN